MEARNEAATKASTEVSASTMTTTMTTDSTVMSDHPHKGNRYECSPNPLVFENVYTVDQRLASGSFGTVYSCHHSSTSQAFAVKIIDRPKLKPKDDTAVFREVSILRTLKGVPYILQLVDFFCRPQELHVVLEFAAGGDVFGALCRCKHYTEDDARNLARILLQAVASLHAHNVVHRDLKPENLLLQKPDDTTSVVVADFGFARQVQGENCQTRCGTPAYCAPEIVAGSSSYGVSCDLWSVGCLLYILISGYPPFSGKNHRDLFRKIRAADFCFHTSHWENVSAEAKLTISQLLTVNVKNRWTAVQALESDWFRVKPNRKPADLRSSLLKMQSFRARRSWKAALSAIGWATSAKFWNPDAVSFGQQLSEWDNSMPSSKRVIAAPHTTATARSRFADRYKVGPLLRKGTSANIFRCMSKQTNEELAVKIVTRRDTEHDEAVLNEVAILQSLTGNKYVVQLLDFYEDKEAFYLVMEYMKGGDVFDKIVEKTHYTEKDARDLTLCLLKGVHSLHSAGIAHRDLKPQNMLLRANHDGVTGDGAILRLADFGFSKRVHLPASLTSRVGTPTYVAPEVLKNIPHDQRVDMWSIGVIIYVLLVGYPPFLEDSQSDLFVKIRTGQWTFTEDWNHISDSAKELIRGLLVTDPKDRWTVQDALRSDWIQQDPNLLSSVNLKGSGLRERRHMLRGLAKSVMFMGTCDTQMTDVPTQAQDDPMEE